MSEAETARVHSYPSIYNFGHKALDEIFSEWVVVEEKVDGSQFSFGVLNGELVCRSKGQQIDPDGVDGMFEPAVETAIRLAPDLIPDAIYRGEFLSKPKHNSLTYSRTPEQNVILFDVEIGLQDFLQPSQKAAEAARLGLECVPVLMQGIVRREEAIETLRELLHRESVLGGAKIEGVVVKNYSRFGPDKKALMAKFVSEQFKEVHSREWKKSNPSMGDVIAEIGMSLCTEARWEKAVQHLRESGAAIGCVQDISAIIKEVPTDILRECEGEIKDRLMAYAWPHIRRAVTRGFPEWYKAKLIEAQLGDNA